MLNLVRRCLAAAIAMTSLIAGAQEPGPRQQEFLPKSGTGRVVVVISGQSGMVPYSSAAQQIADAGFRVLLVDGNEFWIKDTARAWGMLKDVITRSTASPHAQKGKVGVVGYSLGGASALTYAARAKDQAAGKDAMERTISNLTQALR